MLLGELLTKIAAKAGKKLDVSSEIEKVEIPEGVDEIVNSFLSEKEARNSETVKAHYFSQFADATDKELGAFKDLLGDETYSELSKEKTFKRIGLLKEKISEAIQAAKEGDKSAQKDVEKYTTEINTLNRTVKELNKKIEDEKASVANEWRNKLINKDVDLMLSQFQYNESIPESFRLKIAREALNEALNKKGATIVESDNKLTLRKASDNALEFTDGDLQTIIQSTLAENKLLKVSEGSPKGQPKSTYVAPSAASGQQSWTQNSIDQVRQLYQEAATN